MLIAQFMRCPQRCAGNGLYGGYGHVQTHFKFLKLLARWQALQPRFVKLTDQDLRGRKRSADPTSDTTESESDLERRRSNSKTMILTMVKI